MLKSNDFKSKKILFTLFMFLATFILLPTNIYALNGTISGSGSQTDPYLIEDIIDLKTFRDNVNSGESYNGKYIKLKNDIDMSMDANPDALLIWTAIGTSSNVFKGTFDGDNHTISNMTTGVNGGNAGLFGYNSGTIKNIKFNNCKISEGSGRTITDGGIVAAKNNASGVIYNIVANNTIINVSSGSGSGYHGLGGIVGYNLGTIDSCANIGGSITSTTNMNYKRIGGIAGQSKGGVIRNSFNTANIDAKSSTVGGIVGDNNVSGDGYSRTIIENCYNWGAIKGHAQVGGVAGENTGGAYLKNSYNAGKTTAIYGPSYAGNIVRNNTNGTIKNAFGIVGGTDNSTSSLVGYGSCEAGQCHKVQNNSTELEELKNSLNAWVDAENAKAGKDVYKHWYIDYITGYPIFAPSVTITFNAGAHGKFSDNKTSKTITTYKGSSWDNTWEPSVVADDGWIAYKWDKQFPSEVNESATYTYTYLRDENKDQIPDIYQKKVTFKIVNGLWEDNTRTDKVVYVTLRDENENYSETGSGNLIIPQNMKADYGYSYGAWDVVPQSIVSGNDPVIYTYAYRYVLSRATVTFKIKNGTWDGTNKDDKIIPITLFDGKATLDQSLIPTGMINDEGYTAGAWDIIPNTDDNGITGDVIYTYTYLRDENKDQIPDIYQKKVTFKIVNGLWEDNTRTDKVVYVTLRDENENYSETGSGNLIIPQNMKADEGFVDGAWDVIPQSIVTGNNPVTYTYKFIENIYGTGEEEIPSDDKDKEENSNLDNNQSEKSENIKNPQTLDNIIVWILCLLMSSLSLISLRKKLFK